MSHEADGNLKKIKGSMKEALGKVAGIDHLEVEGAQEKADGQTQEAKGRKKDALERERADATPKTPPDQ